MTVNNIARNQMSESMMRVASGQRVNSAADDPAGLAIIETMNAQIQGLDQGTRNTADMQALVNTAEGGMETIGDSVNRIRELSVQALNDTNSPANRAMLQQEIGQLLDHIESAVGNVQFNNINLLDGSVEGFNTASGPDGTGAAVNINDMGDLASAIADFNVTGNIDLDRLDAALADVTGARAELGAMSNRFEYTAGANTVSSLNLADARSRIGDADIAAEMMQVEQERVIDEMQTLLQQQQQQQAEDDAQILVSTGVAGVI